MPIFHDQVLAAVALTMRFVSLCFPHLQRNLQFPLIAERNALPNPLWCLFPPRFHNNQAQLRSMQWYEISSTYLKKENPVEFVTLYQITLALEGYFPEGGIQ
jgi:hypothetical protein